MTELPSDNATAQADELKQRLTVRLDLQPGEKIVCPREKSPMTPCVARDGGICVAEGDVCVGCGQRVDELLAVEKQRGRA